LKLSEVTMRPFTPIAALAVVFAAAGCTVHSTPRGIQETHTFPARAGKLVRLDVRSLDVQVKVAEADTITARVELQAQSTSRNASRRWIERNTPVFEDSDSVLEVRLPERADHGLFFVGFFHSRGRLDLVVPPACRLEVKTSSGDVRIEGGATLAGPIRVNTSSGDVTVTGGVGELIADTSSGDVRVSGTELASLEADTSSGDVTLSGGAGRAVVDTSSGDVHLEKMTGAVSVDTSSGDVWTIWTSLPAASKVHVRTSSGDVRLRLPEGTALSGEITTSSGRVHSAIPATSEDRGHRLRFAAPAAAVGFEVRTTSGDVNLRTGS
jgi:hypothetical protein